MPHPDPTTLHPIAGQPRVVFLKPLIDSPLIEVGEYSYYDDPDYAEDFASRNVLYHYGPERLIIGKFCAIATNVQFIMNGANHRTTGITTFPFPVFGASWGNHINLVSDLPNAGDTVVGHDVWIGRDVMIMPGVNIGTGAIVASGSVVVRDVEPYSIVGGNPAELLRSRFSAEQVAHLLKTAWWDWPIEDISEKIVPLMSGQPADI